MAKYLKYSYENEATLKTVDPGGAGTRGGSALCHAQDRTGFRASPGALLFGTD